MIKQFAIDVDQGLSQTTKSLPSKYFYDKKGDAIFVKIMQMEEYYLMRSEMEIFSEQTQKIITAFAQDKSIPFELIELGAGDGTKTKKLLKALSDNGYKYEYIPIDISKNSLEQLKKSLKQELPQVTVKTKHGEYFSILESLKNSHHPKVLLFLGSNMGNLSDDAASEFIYHLGESLNKSDKLLIGVDLIKSPAIVLPAYNDKSGITQEFNLNLLRRINNELDGDFNLHNFKHIPEYTEAEGVAKSYLQSKLSQTVTIKKIGKTYNFAKGEKIHTEISRKYNDDILAKILSKTDFEVIAKLMDKKNYFADYILNRMAF